MDYPSESSAGLHNGKFTDGDPVNDIPPSPDKAAYMNALYDELRNAIIAGGEVPDEAKLNQLATVITKAMSGGKVLGEPFWHQGVTPPVGAMEFKQQILNRVTYSKLFNALQDADRNIDWVTQAEASSRPGCWHTGDGSTTFGVPMLLGDFIQNWDSSGAIESDAVMGQWLASQFASHSHAVATYTDTSAMSADKVTATAGSYMGTAQTNAAGGDDTYPRHVKWMLCFRYE